MPPAAAGDGVVLVFPVARRAAAVAGRSPAAATARRGAAPSVRALGAPKAADGTAADAKTVAALRAAPAALEPVALVPGAAAGGIVMPRVVATPGVVAAAPAGVERRVGRRAGEPALGRQSAGSVVDLPAGGSVIEHSAAAPAAASAAATVAEWSAVTLTTVASKRGSQPRAVARADSSAESRAASPSATARRAVALLAAAPRLTGPRLTGPRTAVASRDSAALQAAVAPRAAVARPGASVGRLRLTRRGRVALAIAGLLATFALLWVAHASAPTERPAVSVPAAVTVRSGDTLWGIATRIAPGSDPRAVVADLQRLNGMNDAALVPGQVLRTR